MLSKELGPAWVPSMTKYEKMVDLEGLAPLDFASLKHKDSGPPETSRNIAFMLEKTVCRDKHW